jgi:hypothetical protein
MSDRLAAARAAWAARPEAAQEQRRQAARASARARRQIADESITVTVKIKPAHGLTPEQLAAWRSFWRAVLAGEPELPAAGEDASDA